MSALHDQLDELLIEYLATLNLYQAAQAKVAAEAKNVRYFKFSVAGHFLTLWRAGILCVGPGEARFGSREDRPEWMGFERDRCST